MPASGARAAGRLVVLAICLVALRAGAREPQALALTATIPLPGVTGRLDHLAIDARGRLFVAALGNDTLEVVDLAAGRRLTSLGGLRRPTGVLYLPEVDRILVANGSDGTLQTFDGASLRALARLEALPDADNLRLDPQAGRIYLGYGDGALAVIDATTLRAIGRVALPAHPESFQLETRGPRVFVNLPDARQIAVVDRNAGVVRDTWRVEGLRSNFPMALDEAAGRLFVAFRDPARLVVFETAAGKRVSDLAICGDADDAFYDSKRARVYVSCGDGFLDVIEPHDASSDLIERIPTRAGARTALFSAENDALYLAVPRRGALDAEVRVFRPER